MNAGSLEQQLLQRQKDKEGKHRASLRQRNWKQNENKNQFSWTESGQARNKGSEDKARNDRLARLISVVRKSLDATEGERKGLKKSVKTRRELIVKPDMLLQHLQLDQYISHCCPYRKGFSSQHRLLEINDNYSLWAIAFSLTTEPHRWDLKTTLNFLFFYSPVLIFAYSCSGLTPLGQDIKISPLAPDPPAPCDPGKPSSLGKAMCTVQWMLLAINQVPPTGLLSWWGPEKLHNMGIIPLPRRAAQSYSELYACKMASI